MKTEVTKMLSAAEASRILGVTPERVRQLERAGRLPAVRTSLGRLFTPAAVEELRQSRAVTSAGAA